MAASPDSPQGPAAPPDRPLGWSRRGFLAALAAGGLAASCRARLQGTGGALESAIPAAEPEPAPAAQGPSSRVPRLPAAFVGHGSPTLALDPAKGSELTRWTARFPRPKAVLVVSAHWEEAPATIGATVTRPLIYDFYGFDDPLYRVTYPAPGAPAVADRVERLLAPHGGTRRDPERGLDHGAWVPLKWMYPEADVPVLPLSLPTDEPARLLALGRALAPLRDEGVLILGSGNVVHNLRRLSGSDDAATPSWAQEFDAWTATALERRDLDALADWRRRAPAASTAHPTVEHFVPLLIAVGAADGGAGAAFPVRGFEFGSISRRCVELG